MEGSIVENVYAIQRELKEISRDPARPAKLLPVTKMRDIESIRQLQQAGISEIGENRAQEIVDKYPALSNDFSFHLIGRLQTNKIKYIINRVCMVHSLDRWPLAEALSKRMQPLGLRMPVLVEINIGGETQKAGIPPEEAETFVRDCARLEGLQVTGLMAMAPMTPDPETARPLFRGMRTLFEALRDQAVAGVQMRELSMGMSGDWRVAAQEGATLVRIGSAIFGNVPR